MTLLCRPSIQLNKSLTVLKTTFFENALEYFLSSKSDHLLSTFFFRPARPAISSPREPTRTMTLLRRPSI